MKKFIFILILPAAFVSFWSCDTGTDDETCDEPPASCEETAYTEGMLTINLTIDDAENPSPTVEIYIGSVESGTLIETVSANSATVTRTLPLGSYSARIAYKHGAATIFAVDGGDIEDDTEDYCTKSSCTACSTTTCHELDEPTLDCTLDKAAFDEYISGESEKCFIATAAFGSPYARQVNVLRGFRDRHLVTNAPGRAFTAWYYMHSPAAADYIREHGALKALVRAGLIAVVWSIEHAAAALMLLLGMVIAAGWLVRRRIQSAVRPG